MCCYAAYVAGLTTDPPACTQVSVSIIEYLLSCAVWQTRWATAMSMSSQHTKQKQTSLWGIALILTGSWCSVLSCNWWKSKYFAGELHHNNDAQMHMSFISRSRYRLHESTSTRLLNVVVLLQLPLEDLCVSSGCIQITSTRLGGAPVRDDAVA